MQCCNPVKNQPNRRFMIGSQNTKKKKNKTQTDINMYEDFDWLTGTFYTALSAKWN